MSGSAWSTTSPSGTSSSETDIESTAKRKLKKRDGTKFKRNGKVISQLRQQTAAAEKQEVMDLSRTNEVMLRQNLGIMLSHHLVQLCDGVFTMPPVIDVGSRLRGYLSGRLQNGYLLRETDPRQEVLMASLVALGARRTLHSSITGLERGKGLSNLDGEGVEIRAMNLGVRRETACRILAQRAVDMAIACNLLEDDSEQAKEAASVLRVALYAADPTNPFTSELAAHPRAHHPTNFPQIHNEFDPSDFAADRMGLSPIGFDGAIAVMRRSPLRISDADLERIYGWNQEQLIESLNFLKIKIDRTNGSRVAMSLLRVLSQYQQRGTCDLAGLPDLCKSVQQIFDMLDAIELAMTKANDVDSAERVPPHVSVLPMMGESLVACESERILRDLAKEQPKVRELILFTKIRFLLWTMKFVEYVNDPMFSTQTASMHSRALVLSVFQSFPAWLDVCVEAAQQHISGEGPYALVGFTWAHLKLLRIPFLHASTVFAKSAQQYEMLCDALSKVNISSNSFGEPEMDRSETDFLDADFRKQQVVAQALVSAALGEIEKLASDRNGSQNVQPVTTLQILPCGRLCLL